MSGSSVTSEIVWTPEPTMLKAIVSAPAAVLASRIAWRSDPASRVAGVGHGERGGGQRSGDEEKGGNDGDPGASDHVGLLRIAKDFTIRRRKLRLLTGG